MPVAGSEFVVEADRVLAAVGQSADLAFLPDKYRQRVSEHNRLRVDGDTAMTPLQGVFAAGDAVTGPATVIEAVAAGHRAAATIQHYLDSGRPEPEAAPMAAPTEFALPDAPPPAAARHEPPLRPLDQRSGVRRDRARHSAPTRRSPRRSAARAAVPAASA